MFKFRLNSIEYPLIASLIDFEVRTIARHNDIYVVSFKKTAISNLTFSSDIVVLVLSALSNDMYRGIRSGLSELVMYLSKNELEQVSFYKEGFEIIVKVTSNRKHLKIFRLKQDKQSIAVTYIKEEFGEIEQISTRLEAGRALAPLHSSEYRRRADQIVQALSSDNRELIFSLPPMMVVMGLTDYCNHKCPFCFRQTDPAYSMTDGNVFTSDHLFNLFLSLGEAGLLSIRLCGEGEDTLHPNYVVYLLLARVFGINIMQITNGSRLSELAPIIARCISVLRVSINGWTPETYIAKHGIKTSDTFETVIKGISAVKSEAKKTLCNNPVILISSVVTPDDCLIYQIDDLADLIRASSSDFVILKRDLQCSRNSSEQQVRIKEHKLIMSMVNGDEDFARSRLFIGNELEISQNNYYLAFSKLEKLGRDVIPKAFPHIPVCSNNERHFRDWITELNLGCILRYIRIEIERLNVFNCSNLHDFYGNLRESEISMIWSSSLRREGIFKDGKRDNVLCTGCGWGDFFTIMNFFLNESINTSLR